MGIDKTNKYISIMSIFYKGNNTPPPPVQAPMIHDHNNFALTSLASFPISPSQVSWRTVDIGNRRRGVSVSSPDILTLGISMTLGLTER